jgi:hypothetical protein
VSTERNNGCGVQMFCALVVAEEWWGELEPGAHLGQQWLVGKKTCSARGEKKTRSRKILVP